jgi:hypothetical protein
MSATPNPMPAIIAAAYTAFARYRPSDPIAVCNCPVCMTPELQRRLQKTPLHLIDASLLAAYTNSAHGWDDGKIADDMRYLLPRYLELIASEDPPDNMGLDTCLRRMRSSSWATTWPQGEADILHRFFDALLVQSLDHLELLEWPVGWLLAFEIKDVLTCAVTAGADIHRILRVWDAAPDPNAAIHMAGIRRNVGMKDGRWRLHSAYLEGDHEPEAEAIGAFVMRPEVEARLEAAFFLIEEPRLQKIVSDALFA